MFKKSHVLLFGSLLIFGGFFFLSFQYFLRMREEVYSDMKISMMDLPISYEEDSDSPVSSVEIAPATSDEPVEEIYEVDYSKYLGVLEIPRIRLKRGFYSADSPYNNVEHNVTFVNGSDLPDVANGNLILLGHSGDSYISFFAYLYLLNVGDDCYIFYNNQAFHYKIVKIYQVEKNGIVNIERNYDKKTLTLITCTRGSDTLQTVYIAEFVG